MTRHPVALLGLLGLVVQATSARAADTIETWDEGATDVELYLGYEGLGLRQPSARAALGELVAGYGLMERFSAFLGATLQGNGVLAEGQGSFRFGLFGTPVDTRHVDLDLIFSVETGGPGISSLALTPGFELNFDLHPDMRSWGLYVRGGARLFGVATGEPDPSGGAAPSDFRYALLLTLGTYVRIARRHQILLESGISFRPEPCEGERRVEVGGLALGYNVTLHERVELINQVFVDIAQPGEKAAVGLMSGLIVSLPSPRH